MNDATNHYSLDIIQMDNIELASFVFHHQQKAAEHRLEADRAGLLLLGRMEASGAKAVDHPGLMVELVVPSPDYDSGKLSALAEHLRPETFAEGCVAAHTETVQVADKWDGRVLRTWARKYGAEVAAIIEAARVPRPARLKITSKPVGEVSNAH